MEFISPTYQSALLETLLAYRDILTNYTGVYYIDIGFKYVNHAPTSQLAIRVHVHQKKPNSQLEKGQILPRQLADLPTDIIQSNLQLHSEPTFRDSRFDPLVGGVAVRNIRHNMLGTLGAIVFDQKNGTWVGLSNYHVFVADSGQPGDAIAQPATANISDIIGTLTRWDEDLDCALCTINSTRMISNRIVDIAEIPSQIKEPLLGMPVVKSGRTTGTTYGVIEGVSEYEFTVAPLSSGNNNTEPLDIEISAPGDSGSLWLDTKDFAAVGLHYAGEKDPAPENERAWAKKMSAVAKVLEISIP